MLRTRRGPRFTPGCSSSSAMAPLRRCSSLRRRPCTGVDCSDANYRETVARLRMLLMDSYLPCRLEGSGALVGKSSAGLADFIERQEEYIQQLEKESRYCRGELTGLMAKLKDLISENEELMNAVRDSLAPAIRPPLGDTQAPAAGTRYCMDLIRPTLGGARSGPGPGLLYESRISELQAQLTQALPSPPPWRLRPAPAVIPPLSPWPWPDPLGVWWGHLGWQRAELRAAPPAPPAPTGGSSDGDVPADALAKLEAVADGGDDADDPTLTASTADEAAGADVGLVEAGDTHQEEKGDPRGDQAGAAAAQEASPELPAPPEDQDLQAVPEPPEPKAATPPPSPPPPGPRPEPQPSSLSSTDSSAEDDAGLAGREQLALTLPGPAEAGAGPKPTITVNVEVKFHVKDRKRKKKSSNNQP
ncbi:Serologically defined colon cancer antigen 8-like protein [Frankliniella fusca]|uniref:Serologically defined colon cancer antigen 8-like protein n=1 Tax=Frankliniella fusca TaxID=407009 RepID=A0AAE1LT99_9NEOP|nr:Serologically defined colon cancer antigen 8-like protein [Frankliniella fusca]